MFVTAILGTLYMWYKKTPDFPLGPRNMFGFLVLRGTAGFFGLFGLYCERFPSWPSGGIHYIEMGPQISTTYMGGDGTD